MKLSSLAGFAIAVFALLGLIFQQSFLAVEPVGIAIQILAVLLMFWARLTFGRRSFHLAANPTGGGLVTAGPYKFLRHPIYAAVLFFVWTGVISHFDAISFALGVAVTAGLSMRMAAEERLVAEKYPEYAVYVATTKRVIPFVL
jgi:protein-S-isoprenylcysteine O-methyltransferase Ste14